MRTRSKLLIAAFAAVALLGLAVGSASARSLEVIRSERGFRITWNPLTVEAGRTFIECAVTLEGTYVRSTYAKLALNRIGSVTGANVGTCAMGTHATALVETLPWEIDYNSFTGRLPTITSITLNLIKVSLEVETGIPFTTRCLFRTEVRRPARGIETVESGGNITGFRADETASIETAGGFLCSFPGPGHLAGTAESITDREASAFLNVQLI